jgi:enterochelin esterase-like enzyme
MHGFNFWLFDLSVLTKKSIIKMKNQALILLLLAFNFNLFSQEIKEVKVCCGTIKHFENVNSAFVDARNVDVWLPENYNLKTKYAVLYMHDGQMLFDSTHTWNHQEWGVDETLTQLKKDNKIKDVIVVGIWNNNKKRHSDYFPQKPFEALNQGQQDSIYQLNRKENQPLFGAKIQSDNYLKFIVNELKPFIDSSFSTKSNRKNTMIAGSSMGGLISLYAICEYPEIFGASACLSTHWLGIMPSENNPIPAVFRTYLKGKLPSPKKHKIYFDYGTATLDAFYKPHQEEVNLIMKSKGFSNKNWLTKEFIGDDHTEKSWRNRLGIPLFFLLKK